MNRRFFPILIVICIYAHVFALPAISGDINDKIWTKENSPYHITDHTTVTNLTIESGVEVLFDGDYQFNIDGDFSAIGSKTDSIHFRPNAGNFAGYPGLHVLPTAQSVEFNYCRIENAGDFGIKVENSQSLIKNSKILATDGYGINIIGSIVEIRRSSILDNSDNGIQISGSGRGYLSNSIINHNSNSGINIDNGYLSLANCIVSHNSQGGITLLSSADTLDFVNSTIAYHTTSYGIGSINGIITGLNSIIYHNSQSVASGGGSVTISFSNIEAPYSGEGEYNLNGDPAFIDAQSLQLSGDSPAVDNGNPDQKYDDTCFPPSLGTNRNDMGAYGGPGACYWFDQMVVIPKNLDFNNVTVFDSMELPVVVKNYRDSQLDISEIYVSGADSLFFNIDQSTASIQPFDSVIISVGFGPITARSYQAILNIKSVSDQIGVNLSGRGVTPDIHITPMKLDYDQIRVGEQKELSFKISNFGLGMLRIPDIQSSDLSFTILDTILPLEIESFSNKDIPVIFSPDTNRSYVDQLLILSNDSDEDSSYVDLEGSGTAPVLSPSKPEIAFGKIGVQEDSIQSITISNTGQDTLFISNVQLLNDLTNSFVMEEYFTEATILPDSTSDTITVLYQPQTTGFHLGTLQITSNDPFQNPFNIDVTGRGVKPAIDISGQDFSFGEVSIGDSITDTIWIKNTGDTTLFIDSIKIVPDNDHFVYVSVSLPLVINGQDSSDALQITYAPKSEVSDSVKLTIWSNDPDQTEIDTLLTGTGVRPALVTIPADSLIFVDVVVGDFIKKTVDLTNKGSGALKIDTVYISGIDSGEFGLDSLEFPIYLSAGSNSFLLGIKFSPQSTGDKNSDLIIKSNDTGTDKYTISLSGAGVVPRIQLSPRHIKFDTVYIGYDYSQNLNISNSSKGILRIESIHISDTLNFSYAGISAGDTIMADSSLTMQVWFHPLADSSGEKSAHIIIASNDPDSASIDISIQGIAKSPVIIDIDPQHIDFDTTFINERDTAQIQISNHGDLDLVVYQPEFESGEMNFSVEDIGDSIIIRTMQSRTISVLFMPQTGGEITDTLVIYSNDPLNAEERISLYGFSIADTSEVIFVVDVTIDTLDFEATEHIFSVKIVKDGPPVTEVFLYIRQGGQINFTALHLDSQTDNMWSVQIASEYIGIRGMEYYVQANYPGGGAVSPDSGQAYPAISIVKNLMGDFSGPTIAQQYQMISLPLDAGGQSLNDLFEDILGPYDNTKYRIFDWSPVYEEYLELSRMDESLQPGKALWLITDESKQLDYTDCKSISSATHYGIELKQGWNMIASPFAFNIDISSINKTPLRGGVIYDYYNEEWIPRSDSVLIPFRGYAVFAEFAATIFIPNIEAGQSLGKDKFLAEKDWHIQLLATRGQLRDRYNFAGVNSRAKNSVDRFDYPEPPKIGNYVELYFKQQNELLTGDFRHSGDEGYIYDFIVKSNSPGESYVEVLPFNLPTDFTWQIISPETGVKHSSGFIRTSSWQQEYQLVVGKMDFVEKISSGFKNIPESFQIAQNYPNPFNPETQVRFELPKSTRISLDIFDILGRKIKTLASNEYREPGYYEIRWHGKNDQGRDVASGLYLLYLKTAEYKKAIKMILQR